MKILFYLSALALILCSTSVEKYKEQGAEYFKKYDFVNAAAAYNGALKLCLTESCSLQLKITLLSNLAMTYLSIFDYEQALTAAGFGLQRCLDEQCFGLKDKLLYRKAKALSGLGKYSEAIETIKTVNNKDAEALRNWLQKKASEEDFKIYEKYKAVDARNDKMMKFEFPMNRANSKFYEKEYVSESLELRNAGGKGKGFFAKKKIEAGELLIVSKAVAYTAQKIPAPGEPLDSALDNELVRMVLQIIQKDSVLAEKILDLSVGSVIYSQLTQDWTVNIVHQIVSTNSFSSNLRQSNSSYRPAGIFIAPSRLNHDCKNNAKWLMFGDWMVIRAIRNINIDEEVTINYVDDCNTKDIQNWGINGNCDHCKNSQADSTRKYSKNDIKATQSGIMAFFQTRAFNSHIFGNFLWDYYTELAFSLVSEREKFELHVQEFKKISLNLELLDGGNWYFGANKAIQLNLCAAKFSFEMGRYEFAFDFLKSTHRIFERYFGDTRILSIMFKEHVAAIRLFLPGYLLSQ